MSQISDTRKLIAHVAARMGGTEVLASKLGISPPVLSHYITGREPIPDTLVLAMVDLLLNELERMTPAKN